MYSGFASFGCILDVKESIDLICYARSCNVSGDRKKLLELNMNIFLWKHSVKKISSNKRRRLVSERPPAFLFLFIQAWFMDSFFH